MEPCFATEARAKAASDTDTCCTDAEAGYSSSGRRVDVVVGVAAAAAVAGMWVAGQSSPSVECNS